MDLFYANLMLMDSPVSVKKETGKTPVNTIVTVCYWQRFDFGFEAEQKLLWSVINMFQCFTASIAQMIVSLVLILCRFVCW